jgi:hypothetical protein
VHPYDATGNNHAALFTIDLGAGDRWLIDICRKATADWLPNSVLDFANAMVPARQPVPPKPLLTGRNILMVATVWPSYSASGTAKFTGGLYLVGRKAIPECNNFNNSLQKKYIRLCNFCCFKIPGTTNGMLGYMFWAAECSGTRSVCTTPD